MHALDAKSAFCKRHIEFKLKVFGQTKEVKDIKREILNSLNTAFPSRTTNHLLTDFIATTTCVGTNLKGCVMWDKLFLKKDDCLFNTLGYKIDPDNTPFVWLYGDVLDLQLNHIRSSIIGLKIKKSEYNGVYRYYISHDLDSESSSNLVLPGLIR